MRRARLGGTADAREATHVQILPHCARVDRAARGSGERGWRSRRRERYSIQDMSKRQPRSPAKTPARPLVDADGASYRQLEEEEDFEITHCLGMPPLPNDDEEGVSESLAAAASKNQVVEQETRRLDAPAKLSFQDMLGLKVIFKCAPARATEVTGEAEVLVDAKLWQLLQHSQVVADTVSTCADSITAEGVTINAPGVPADAARAVLDVLLKPMTARMWYEIDTFKCEWAQVDPGGGDPKVWKRKESSFDWVDRDTYRFLDMFQFESLRAAVDAFVSKFPTMDTIAARDAVSPTDASWASERELAKVAEFLFYDDPSEPRSSTRLLVERYLKELSSALLARVLGHIAWDAEFKYCTCYTQPDHEVDLGRNYEHGANENPKLIVKKEWKTQLVHGGPACCR